MDFWTPEKEELLRKRLNQGVSYSRIGIELGCGRGAISGKVDRLGLAQRGDRKRFRSSRSKQEYTADKNSKNKVVKFKPPKPVPGPSSAVVRSKEIGPAPDDVGLLRKGIADLEPSDCRYPIGDPGTAEFHFCARARPAGLAYCDHHTRLCYEPKPAPRLRVPDEDKRMKRWVV